MPMFDVGSDLTKPTARERHAHSLVGPSLLDRGRSSDVLAAKPCLSPARDA